MKNKILVFLISTTALFISCENSTKSKTSNTIDTLSVADKRSDYLKKKDWVAAEDMLIIEKGFTPIKNRGFLDETERKNAFIDLLKKHQIPESKIQHFVEQIERIHGARTGQWNYEYIQARFEVYKYEMSKDAEWKKNNELYQNKLKSDSALIKNK